MNTSGVSPSACSADQAERVVDRRADVAVGRREQAGDADRPAQAAFGELRHGARVLRGPSSPRGDRARRRQDRIKVARRRARGRGGGASSWNVPAVADPALRLQGVVKRYGPVTAVAGLDLVLPEATCVGLLGPNGAGKSTTMKLLTAQAIADEG